MRLDSQALRLTIFIGSGRSRVLRHPDHLLHLRV